jgi:predicted transcriptional regulator
MIKLYKDLCINNRIAGRTDKEYNKHYQQTEKGKECIKRYSQTEKGKKSNKERNKRYRDKIKALQQSI